LCWLEVDRGSVSQLRSDSLIHVSLLSCISGLLSGTKRTFELAEAARGTLVIVSTGQDAGNSLRRGPDRTLDSSVVGRTSSTQLRRCDSFSDATIRISRSDGNVGLGQRVENALEPVSPFSIQCSRRCSTHLLTSRKVK